MLKTIKSRYSGGRSAAMTNFVIFTMRRFYEDGLMQSVGALTYSTLLALVPLLVIAFAIFSAFPAFDMVKDQLQAVVYDNLLPETGVELRGYLDRFTANASELTMVGVLALVLSAILLLSTIEATLNRIWRVERTRPFLARLLVFWALLTLGPLLLGASFAVSSETLAWFYETTGDPTNSALPPVLRMLFATIVQAITFTTVFKLVPARAVRLRDAAIGGAIGGFGFEILKWGFQAFIANSGTYTTIYGAVSVVPIFLIWTYACWTVIIMGAVFAASLPDWRRNRNRDEDVHLSPPKTLAVALAVLGVLAQKARSGGGSVDDETLAEEIPLGKRDALIEAMRSNGYLVETDRGRFALARDLNLTTLADLANDLELTLGTKTEVSKASGTLSDLLARLAKAEEDILGTSLADLSIDDNAVKKDRHA